MVVGVLARSATKKQTDKQVYGLSHRRREVFDVLQPKRAECQDNGLFLAEDFKQFIAWFCFQCCCQLTSVLILTGLLY